MDGDDFSRIRRAEGNALFSLATILKHRHEQRFTGEQALAGPHQSTQKTAVGLRTIPEDRFHFDAIVHVHHAAGLSDSGFHGIKFDLDELHLLAEDFVINFVHWWHKRSWC